MGVNGRSLNNREREFNRESPIGLSRRGDHTDPPEAPVQGDTLEVETHSHTDACDAEGSECPDRGEGKEIV